MRTKEFLGVKKFDQFQKLMEWVVILLSLSLQIVLTSDI